MELPPTSGAFDLSAALDSGWTRGQVRHAAQVERVSYNLYAPSSDPEDLTQRCRSLAVAMPEQHAFSHWTAAALLEVPARSAERTHVTVDPQPVNPQRADLAIHRAALPEADRMDVDGVSVTTGSRLFVDLAARLRPAELTAVGDALLASGLATIGSLTVRTEAAVGQRGVRTARAVLPHLDGRAQSAPESMVRYWLIKAGIPPPIPQCPVTDRSGALIGHSDLGWDEAMVVGEYEGKDHALSVQFQRDVERYSEMAAAGWLVVRFSAVHLRDPDLIVRRVRSALRSRGVKC